MFPGGSGQAAEEDAGERPKKRAKKQKEYFPSVGSANYAFLIILLKVQSYTPCAPSSSACMLLLRNC